MSEFVSGLLLYLFYPFPPDAKVGNFVLVSVNMIVFLSVIDALNSTIREMSATTTHKSQEVRSFFLFSLLGFCYE